MRMSSHWKQDEQEEPDEVREKRGELGKRTGGREVRKGERAGEGREIRREEEVEDDNQDE
ncbi:hypothetical protein E2C01_011904 [Portunus trituberculatus]|uniref:Uncharacterized protein n=1 Tax=Portunus trituberculatus TaxID=210409 RepID=A0A5B7DCB2_PORTR|nr:hypothetical protein [Portunus trituberculatus]